MGYGIIHSIRNESSIKSEHICSDNTERLNPGFVLFGNPEDEADRAMLEEVPLPE
ncbi:MAG: hypothetical protein KAR40_00720 [Candidatus Sabulitectum sp.]|nr:hypothetical protein [Candidatus Sabulitectum sp.]